MREAIAMLKKDDPVAVAMRDAIVAVLRGFATREDRVEFALVALHVGYEVTRGLVGNAFMSEWLNVALEDLATEPPKVVLRELQ